MAMSFIPFSLVLFGVDRAGQSRWARYSRYSTKESDGENRMEEARGPVLDRAARGRRVRRVVPRTVLYSEHFQKEPGAMEFSGEPGENTETPSR